MNYKIVSECALIWLALNVVMPPVHTPRLTNLTGIIFALALGYLMRSTSTTEATNG